MAQKAKKVWTAWLGRGKDAEWKVRRGWVEKVGKMMSGKGAELKPELERKSVLPARREEPKEGPDAF